MSRILWAGAVLFGALGFVAVAILLSGCEDPRPGRADRHRGGRRPGQAAAAAQGAEVQDRSEAMIEMRTDSWRELNNLVYAAHAKRCKSSSCPCGAVAERDTDALYRKIAEESRG